MNPGSVVLRYSPEKWHERQNLLPQSLLPQKLPLNSQLPVAHRRRIDPSPSPSRFVTLSYQRRAARRKEKTQYIEKPIADSLRSLQRYEDLVAIPDRPEKLRTKKSVAEAPKFDTKVYVSHVQHAEKEWYHDLTNVAHRLRLLRDTFKVIQLVRKKRSMGERADFRSVHDFKTSRTGSPTILDDERSEEDEDTVSSAVEIPTPNRRGRPKKKQTRGRKPGKKLETPAAPTRRSRRVGVISSAGDATGDSRTEQDEEGKSQEPQSSQPPEAQTTEEVTAEPILHLPPILPSQRHAMPLVIHQFGHGDAAPPMNAQKFQGLLNLQGPATIPSIPSIVAPVQPPTTAANGQAPALSESTMSIIESLKKSNPELGIMALSQAYNSTQYLPPIQRVQLPPLKWANSTQSNYKDNPLFTNQMNPTQMHRLQERMLEAQKQQEEQQQQQQQQQQHFIHQNNPMRASSSRTTEQNTAPIPGKAQRHQPQVGNPETQKIKKTPHGKPSLDSVLNP